MTFALFGLVAAGCASSGTRAPSTPSRNTSIMDTTALRRPQYSTVYDAISHQHADWLLARGAPSNGVNPTLGVWLEGTTQSRGVDFLRNIRPNDIRQVRRLSTTESRQAYNWPWGGLVVTLR